MSYRRSMETKQRRMRRHPCVLGHVETTILLLETIPSEPMSLRAPGDSWLHPSYLRLIPPTSYPYSCIVHFRFTVIPVPAAEASSLALAFSIPPCTCAQTRGFRSSRNGIAFFPYLRRGSPSLFVLHPCRLFPSRLKKYANSTWLPRSPP